MKLTTTICAIAVLAGSLFVRAENKIYLGAGGEDVFKIDKVEAKTVSVSSNIVLGGESRTNWPTASTNLSAYNNDVPFLTAASVASNVPQFPAMREPTGFPDTTNSTISLTTNGVFTLAGTNFPVWYRGTRILLNTQTNTVPNIPGVHFHYLTSAGVLSSMTTPWVIEAINALPVAISYYNTNQGHFAIGDERHGVTMDGMTHAYLHETLGTRYEHGGAITHFALTTGNPAGNSNSQIAVTAPITLWDEDIIYNVTTNVGQALGQNLGNGSPFSPAYIPTMYKLGSGTNVAWYIDEPTPYPFKQMTNGTGQIVAGYNVNNGGAWSNVAPANNRATVYWIYMANNYSYPIVSIPHNASYADVPTAASQSSPSALFSDGLFLPEMKLLYRLIYFNQNYTTETDTRLSQVDDYRLSQPLPVASQTTASHASLNNLDYTTSGHTGFQPSGDYLTNGAAGTSTNLSQYNNDAGFITNAPAGIPTNWSAYPAVQNVDMGGHSITNINTNSLVFTDGTSISSEGWRTASAPGPFFHIYSTAGQAFTNVVYTKVNLPSVVSATPGCVTNSRFTPNVPGRYLLVGKCHYACAGSQSAFVKNGETIMNHDQHESITESTFIVEMNGTTDWVELWYYQASGSTITNLANVSYTTFFMGSRLP